MSCRQFHYRPSTLNSKINLCIALTVMWYVRLVRHPWKMRNFFVVQRKLCAGSARLALEPNLIGVIGIIVLVKIRACRAERKFSVSHRFLINCWAIFHIYPTDHKLLQSTIYQYENKNLFPSFLESQLCSQYLNLSPERSKSCTKSSKLGWNCKIMFVLLEN